MSPGLVFGAHGAPYDPAQAVGCAVRTTSGGKALPATGKNFLRPNLPHNSRLTTLDGLTRQAKNPCVNAGGNNAMHFAPDFAMLTGLRRLAAAKGRSRSRGKYRQTPVRNYQGDHGHMKIVCNGTAREIAAGATLLELIRELDLDPETVVAEVEGRIVPRPEYETFGLAEGNILELIRFVGGG